MARKMWHAAPIWLVAGGLLGSAPVAATDDGDAAWATARRDVPADVPVYRSAWLTERFGTPPTAESAGVGYRGAGSSPSTV
jgi:hypothetical protein